MPGCVDWAREDLRLPLETAQGPLLLGVHERGFIYDIGRVVHVCRPPVNTLLPTPIGLFLATNHCADLGAAWADIDIDEAVVLRRVAANPRES